MALNADYRKIENYEGLYREVEGGKELAQPWETYILLSIPVGLGEISEKNLDEWWFRLCVLEKLHGKFFKDGDGKEFGFAYADLRRLLGLRTNASKLTRKQFLKNCASVLEREGGWLATRLKREWDEAQAEGERLGQPWELWQHPLNQEEKKRREVDSVVPGAL